MTREISEDQFEDLYRPRTVPGKDPALWDVQWEREDSMKEDPRHVWTVVEGDDGGLYATPGFHYVNRLYDLVTEVPWEDEDIVGVWCAGHDDEDWEDNRCEPRQSGLNIPDSTTLAVAARARGVPLMAGPAPEGQDGDVFDAYEIEEVAEYADPGGENFCEPIYTEEDAANADEEAIGRMFTLYGHFSTGGVHAIADAPFGGEAQPRDKALDYITRLAYSIADGKPVDGPRLPERED